jgi:hypothetical protein
MKMTRLFKFQKDFGTLSIPCKVLNSLNMIRINKYMLAKTNNYKYFLAMFT